VRLEPAARERQQLGLQVAGDEVDRLPAGGDPDAQRAARHRLDRRAVVVDLHRRELRRERADLLDGRRLGTREEPDADGMPRLEHGRGHDVPLAVEPRDKVLEGLRVADLLHGEHVGAHAADHVREAGELGLVDGLARRPELAAGAEQVLDVPRRQDDHRASFVR
jgi:hypothetical protein